MLCTAWRSVSRSSVRRVSLLLVMLTRVSQSSAWRGIQGNCIMWISVKGRWSMYTPKAHILRALRYCASSMPSVSLNGMS